MRLWNVSVFYPRQLHVISLYFSVIIDGTQKILKIDDLNTFRHIKMCPNRYCIFFV